MGFLCTKRENLIQHENFMSEEKKYFEGILCFVFLQPRTQKQRSSFMLTGKQHLTGLPVKKKRPAFLLRTYLCLFWGVMTILEITSQEPVRTNPQPMGGSTSHLCSFEDCKGKELLPVICPQCEKCFCLV